MPLSRSRRALKCRASTPVAASSRTDAAPRHDLDASGRLRRQRTQRSDALLRRVAASGGEHPAASGADDRFERLPGIARHVERPVKRHLHPLGLAHELRRARLVHLSGRCQQSENHPVGSVFAGEADLFGHQRHLVVGVEKISAPGAYHHAQPQARQAPGIADQSGGRGRAAFEGSGAEFDALNARPPGDVACIAGIGAEFSRHNPVIIGVWCAGNGRPGRSCNRGIRTRRG